MKYNRMTNEQLKEIASELDIADFDSMKKAELVEAITNKQEALGESATDKYHDLSKEELYDLLDEKEILYQKRTNKAQLIELLNGQITRDNSNTKPANYSRMKISELIALANERNLELPAKAIKKNVINILEEDDELSKTDFVAHGSKEIEDRAILEFEEEKSEVIAELDDINMRFDASEEKIVTKVSDAILDIARKNGNIIDDITVDVRLMGELGAEYNKRAFAKVQKKLKKNNVDIDFTSDELEATIADYAAIEEDINDEEINYTIDALLKGMDTHHESDEVKNFLSTINEYPLLSKAKERELGKIIATAHEKMDSGEELNFFENEEYEEARTLLSLSNKRLVVSVAKKYINRGMDLIDLVMEGMLGLEKAILKFDYELSYKFSTYATWWVRQGITRAIADKSKVIRVPVHMVETINKVTKIQRELTQKIGQEPTYEQIGNECTPKMSVDEIEHIFNIARDPIALEMPIGEDNSSLEAFIEDDKNMSQVEESEKNELRRKLLEVIEEIPEREGEVLLYRYGLYDLNTEPLKKKLYVLQNIHNKLLSEEIDNSEVEQLLMESEELSEKIKVKYAKRIMQNNEKYLDKYEEIRLIMHRSDKKSIEKVKKYDLMVKNITQTNLKYLERIITMTQEQIEVTEKIEVLTEGVVKPLTLEEVGQLFDVTRERIRQIETKGKRKLKAIVDKERMDLFLNE